MLKSNKIYIGNSAKVLKHLDDESVDLIATDPPYGIGFMGKSWDKALPDIKIWEECLRIMRPGAFIFVMCIPRQDCMSRMIIKLEDAGFQANYTPLFWTFATGFPKGTSASRMIDKHLGFRRKGIIRTDGQGGPSKVFGWDNETRMQTVYETGLPCTPEAEYLDGSYLGFNPKPAVEVILIGVKPFTTRFDRREVYKILGEKYDYWYASWTRVASTNIAKLEGKYNRKFEEGDIIERRLALKTNLNDEIILNRQTVLQSKPFKDTKIGGSLIQALINGKSLSWMDNCRIPYAEGKEPRKKAYRGSFKNVGMFPDPKSDSSYMPANRGRFPSNLLVSDKIIDSAHIPDQSFFGKFLDQSIPSSHIDDLSYSHFFDLDKWWEKKISDLPGEMSKIPFLFSNKPRPTERNFGLDGMPKRKVWGTAERSLGIFEDDGGRLPRENIHPTVKPIKLMAYLIMLGSRRGDLVVDPFCGSGATGIAAILFNRRFIGIELQREYAVIAHRRCAYAKQQLEAARKERKREYVKQ